MRKILNVIIFLLPIFCFSQQNKWIIANVPIGSSNEIPYYDFSTNPPTVSLKTLKGNYRSNQTVANGEYCNICTKNPIGLSEFFITGDGNTIFDNSSSYALQIQYEQINSCDSILSIFRNGSGDPLSHESLTELAMGNGHSPGTYICLLVGNSLPGNWADSGGNNVYVYEFDFINSNVNANRIKSVRSTINNALLNRGIDTIGNRNNNTGFAEGVALGTIFTYTGANLNNVDNTSTLTSGTEVRSIYVATVNGYIFHLFLNPINLELYFSDLYKTNANSEFGVSEMDLSFPPTGTDSHPQLLALAGWVRADLRYYRLDGNGVMSPGDSLESVNNRTLTVEFDRSNRYLFYDIDGSIYRYDLNSNLPITINSKLVHDTINSYTQLENAGNGRIYAMYGPLLHEIVNPSQTPPLPTKLPVVDLINSSVNSSQLKSNTSAAGGLPDWVDGEDPLEFQGVPLTICLQDCPEFQGSIYQANFSMNGNPFKTINISPSDPCQTIYVCPNTTVNLSINVNGTIINEVYNVNNTGIADNIDLRAANKCLDSATCDDCCNSKLKIVKGQTDGVHNVPDVVHWSGGETMSFAKEIFSISQAPVLPITELKISIADISFNYNYDKCAKCINNPAKWGSLAYGKLTPSTDNVVPVGTAPNQLFGTTKIPETNKVPASWYTIPDKVNNRELIWENPNGAMLAEGDEFPVNIAFPEFSQIPCCATTARVCYKISWKDANCQICEGYECFNYKLSDEN